MNLDLMGSRVSPERTETRVKMDEEAPPARRADLVKGEVEEFQAAQVLQVHREDQDPTVNVDPKEILAFQDFRVNQDQLETQDYPDVVALMDKRANQGIRGLRGLRDHRDTSEHRVRMEEMVMDLQDPKVSREILVFLVFLVYRGTTVSREPKDTQEKKGTRVEGEFQVMQDCRARKESQD